MDIEPAKNGAEGILNLLFRLHFKKVQEIFTEKSNRYWEWCNYLINRNLGA